MKNGAHFRAIQVIWSKTKSGNLASDKSILRYRLDYVHVHMFCVLAFFWISAWCTVHGEIIQSSGKPHHLSIILLKDSHLFKIVKSVINFCLKNFSNSIILNVSFLVEW